MNINFSTLKGTKEQKLEALYFMKMGTTATLNRLDREGSFTKLAKQQDKLEAINIEIEKITA